MYSCIALTRTTNLRTNGFRRRGNNQKITMAHIRADPAMFAGTVRRFPIGTGSSGVTITITFNTETGFFDLSITAARTGIPTVNRPNLFSVK